MSISSSAPKPAEIYLWAVSNSSRRLKALACICVRAQPGRSVFEEYDAPHAFECLLLDLATGPPSMDLPLCLGK